MTAYHVYVYNYQSITLSYAGVRQYVYEIWLPRCLTSSEVREPKSLFQNHWFLPQAGENATIESVVDLEGEVH